jgi:hypothetical protein
MEFSSNLFSLSFENSVLKGDLFTLNWLFSVDSIAGSAATLRKIQKVSKNFFSETKDSKVPSKKDQSKSKAQLI